MKRRAIEVRIEKLILQGLGREDGERIKVSLERELTRLLADQGAFKRWASRASIDRLNGGQIAVGSGDKEDSAGIQIARAIYGAIQK